MPDSFPLCRSRIRVMTPGPEDVSAWYELGIALSTLGNRLGALLALRHALERNDGHVPSHLALGRLLFDCGQVEHALLCFERANAIREPYACINIA